MLTRCLQQAFHGNRENALDIAHRNRAHGPFIGTQCLAAFQRNHPTVQRAGDRLAVDDALAERPTLVRAMVLDSEDLFSAVRNTAILP